MVFGNYLITLQASILLHHVFPNKYISNEESKVQLLQCKETISRNMLYALFVILRTLLPLNVIHLMITNLCLKSRAHTYQKQGKIPAGRIRI